MGAKSERTSVALPKTIVAKARALSALVSKNGWIALGIDREDPATLTAIFEQAIDNLAGLARPSKGRK